MNDDQNAMKPKPNGIPPSPFHEVVQYVGDQVSAALEREGVSLPIVGAGPTPVDRPAILKEFADHAGQGVDLLVASGLPLNEALASVAGCGLKVTCDALFLSGRSDFEIRRLFKRSIPVLRARFKSDVAAMAEEPAKRIIVPGDSH